MALPEYAKAKADRDVLFLIGGMSIEERRRVVVYEPGTGRLRIVLASFPAGGVGLNLQWANLVIFLDRNWNPQVCVLLLLLPKKKKKKILGIHS